MWYVNDAIRNAIAEGATQVLYKLCDMWIIELLLYKGIDNTFYINYVICEFNPHYVCIIAIFPVLYKLCDMWINKSMRAVYTDIIVLYKLCDMWITKPETQQSME